MTPNKLPPLPEYLEWLIDECRENAQMAGFATSEQRGWDHMAVKLEALRQSQSLPAGAVAGGPVFYVQRTYDCNAGEDRGEIIPTLPANLIGKRVRLVPVDAAIHVEYNWEEDCKSAESALEAMTDAFNNVCDELKALRADASEKGEDAIEAMAQVIYEAHSEQYESLVLPVWGPLLPEGTSNHWRHIARKVLATQPAQASEVVITDAMVGAVGSKLYVYWNEVNESCRDKYREKVRGALASAMATDFPECSGTPSDCPENEGYGCCALATSSQETASE